MMKRVCFYLFSALLIIFISSCSSTRSMKKGVSIGNLSESEYMEELISRSPGWDAITAKMSLAVDLNGKGPTKVNGTLRMKRDEVIQLSIAPFLGIEVARAEISPDGVLVMDRMNKRYVQFLWMSLRIWQRLIWILSLQALFMNEIFLPGKTTLSARDISAFTVHPENEHAVLEVKNGKKFAYRFRTTADEGLLKESHIGLAGTSYGLRWKYDKFRPLEKKQFPSHYDGFL